VGGKDGLAVEAWSQDGSRKLDAGQLSVINNQVDATSGTVTLKGTFSNPRNLLWPGAFVSIRLVLEVQKNGLTVPSAAVQRGPQGAFVWTLAPDGTARQAVITVEQSTHGQVLVSSGLSAGEQVVIDGQYGLTPGARIAAVSGGQQGGNQQLAGPMRSAETNRLGIAP
jgi:multidrug efflux system membrane fusion protein